MIRLQTSNYQIVLDDDPNYTPGADNLRIYEYEYWFGEQGCRPSSQHSIRVMEGDSEVASCIILATGGASAVNEHSALLHGQSCIVAVSSFMCSLAIPSLHLQWHTQVDWATCFGVYHATKHNCYISHGELDVACVSYMGKLVWSVSGKDIFTNGFRLNDDYIEVVDWNNEIYHIELSSGESYLIDT